MTSPNKAKLKPAVILIADRTLSARYKILFEGIFATMQTTQLPELAMRCFLSPAAAVDTTGRARTLPLGLRRVEAALLRYTDLTDRDVVCTTPERLHQLMGPWVNAVLFSSSDPLGMGMSNTTTTHFWSGQLYTSYWTQQLLTQLKIAKQKFGFKIIAGGAGAWQYKVAPQKRSELGIDVVFQGYFENAGPRFITDLLSGNEINDYTENETCVERITPIAGASTLGIIELSRGCGKGCHYCAMSRNPMEHLTHDIILSDIRRNRSAGVTSVVSGSEDFFRYGGRGGNVNFEALAELLEKMNRLDDLSFIQIDHGNISSILQFSDAQLCELRHLLSWKNKTDYLWVNMGIESANGQLVQANCPGKAAPFDSGQWQELVKEAADKMTRCGFFSVFSIILGLPGETPDDIRRTKGLVDYLGTQHAVIFPIFYEPIKSGETKNRFTLECMTRGHLELYRACYEINFKEVPNLFWDNQRAGGVSLAKRSLFRVLGRGEIFAWRKAFKQVGKQIDARQK